MRISVLILSLILCFGCSENSTNPVINDDSKTYEIYSVILNDQFDNSGLILVVSDSTGGTDIRENSYNYFLENLNGVTTDMLDAFNELNATRIRIKQIPGIDHVFRSEYTGSDSGRVILTFSKIAFNDDETKAIVMLGEYYAPLVGAGFLFLLERENNEWKISESIMVWIS